MPVKNNIDKRWKLLLLVCIIILAGIALLVINRIITQIKTDEKKKVKIWAEALNRKAELVAYADSFFEQIHKEEQKRVDLFILAQKYLMEQPLESDVDFYYHFITDNTTIPIIITNEHNVILHSQNCEIPEDVKVLSGNLLKEFSIEPPSTFNTYGFKYNVYYKESKIYTDLRVVLNNLTQSFLSEITDNSIFVPVIITDSTQTTVIAAGNIKNSEYGTPEKLSKTIQQMQADNIPIIIHLQDNKKVFVFYEKSALLKMLQYYPIIYFLVFFLFLFLSYFLFSYFKKAEQNQVWVGMAKETAHQLGTPISSIIAWVEYMKLKNFHLEIAEEMEKDVNRLEVIAQRFSKIGSKSELKAANILEVINNSIAYLKTRTPKKIEFSLIFPEKEKIMVPVNIHLIEWVIENICKNAIDAMEGNGVFTILVTEDKKQVFIDFTDTGKGIAKNNLHHIFSPGFTTKQRGWGLGLSLSERIIKIYHKGKIFVKSTTPDKGTTFRIILKKEESC